MPYLLQLLVLVSALSSIGLPLIFCLSEGTYAGDNSILAANNVRIDLVMAGHASTLPGVNIFIRLQLRNMSPAGDPVSAGHTSWQLKHDGKGRILQKHSPGCSIRV